jgi:Domain of unknown function (DUF6378)
MVEMSLEEILNERQGQYGDATVNFKKIGVIWGQLLDLPYSLDAYQVAQLFIAAKLVRISANPDHQDSWFDIQGYAKHGLDSL